MRVGLVGLGALYYPHAIGGGLRAMAGVEFLAAATLGVSDGAIKTMTGVTPTEFAEKYGVRLYVEAEEMIERERLDTVAIISRPSEHTAWTERMAALGMNIYMPKSFTTTVADADRIIEAGKRYGVKIAVGPNFRFHPTLRTVKAAVDEGLIGEPFALRLCHHHHGTLDVFKPGDWYRDAQEGGPELSLGWYGVDVVLFLMADRVKTVFADYGTYTTPESPFMDCGRMVLHMARGGVASFDMYFCNRFAYPTWQLELLGPKGVVSIHRTEGSAQSSVVGLDTAAGYRVLPQPSSPVPWEMVWADEFLRGVEPEISAEVAKEITVISLAARESSRAGQIVTL